MSFSAPPVPTSRVLIIGGDRSLREFCRDRLAWIGCAVHFARDITDVITNGFAADIMVADLPGGEHAAATLRHLAEYAEATSSALIALADDLAVMSGLPAIISPVQVLLRPCAPDALCQAVAIARSGRAPGACRT
jgi:hypothetical protein